MKTKKQNTIVIETRDDADRALQRIGELERFIEGAEKDAGDAIDLIRERLVDDTDIQRETLAQNEAALEAWATANKEQLFKEPRSMELNWGKIGFRWTPWKIKFLNKLKVKTIVEKLKANKMSRLIRTEESVDKEKALNYDNETLAPLGMKKVHTDEFFYEVKREEVK
jgi:phage host-nuclease inhibitor protein Gam